MVPDDQTAEQWAGEGGEAFGRQRRGVRSHQLARRRRQGRQKSCNRRPQESGEDCEQAGEGVDEHLRRAGVERNRGTGQCGGRGELDPQQHELAPKPVRKNRSERSGERRGKHPDDTHDSDAGRAADVVREHRQGDEEAPFGDDRRAVHDLQAPQRRVPQDRRVRRSHIRKPPSHRMHRRSISHARLSRVREP